MGLLKNADNQTKNSQHVETKKVDTIIKYKLHF